jgi:uncharacterized coiled-coil DUF342 family protein
VLDKENPESTALEVAYKLARARMLMGLKTKETKKETVDLVTINTLITEIKNKVNRFASIKTGLTKATSAINGAQGEIDTMKEELIEKLEELGEKTTPKAS